MKLSNNYLSLGESFYKESSPESFENPELILWNSKLADELMISNELQNDASFLAQAFSGNKSLNGSIPIATAYAGHQFGHFVPQLGDGRAHLLGDVIDTFDQKREIQLKGSGITPFSRGGDGRCALGPAIREYIMSEAMFALGIPTTRCLAVVTTGETVFRNCVLPGAVVTRVAASHIRVGTFQYFAAKGDVQSLQKLCDYTIVRHYPELMQQEANKAVLLLESVMQKQIELIVQWMQVGFIHGVMNTDNTALSGETIDYGPCAMMGSYNPETVYSSIDKMGRYAFGNQPSIAQWNMARFADCLLPLVHENEEKAVAQLMTVLESFPEKFEQTYIKMMGNKFGFTSVDAENKLLIHDILNVMKEKQLDYTRTFHALTNAISLPEVDEKLADTLGSCYPRWQQCLAVQAQPLEKVQQNLRRFNPVVIPRNHHMEAVIQRCEKTGDMTIAKDFLHVLKSPYQEISGTHAYQDAAPDDDAHYQTFCGT